MSPVVGSYFGTGSRTPEPAQREAILPDPENDDDLDFWGRPHSPNPNVDMEDDSESDESNSDETMEDDAEDEDEDEMDLFGHR